MQPRLVLWKGGPAPSLNCREVQTAGLYGSCIRVGGHPQMEVVHEIISLVYYVICCVEWYIEQEQLQYKAPVRFC